MEALLTLLRENGPRIAASVIVILLVFCGCGVLVRLVNKRMPDPNVRHRTRRVGVYVLALLGVALLGLIWLKNVGDISMVVGIIGAGVALALQKAVLSFVGWVVIIVRRPFDIGDRIQFGEVGGDVIDIGVFHTSLLEIGNWVASDQSTGRMVLCPNSDLFTGRLYNYTKGFPFIWDELAVTVTFESDWRRAQEILQRHGEAESKRSEGARAMIARMADRYPIEYKYLTPTVYVRIGVSGVCLILRYLVPVRQRRAAQDQLSRAVLESFAQEPSITLAYPTQRLVGVGESRPAAEAPNANPDGE